jgi:hypothetical protein
MTGGNHQPCPRSNYFDDEWSTVRFFGLIFGSYIMFMQRRRKINNNNNNNNKKKKKKKEERKKKDVAYN